MNLAASVRSEELSDARKAAFIKLLADDDTTIYQSIREQILAIGPTATEWLRPHTLSRDPALRRRTQELVSLFDRQAGDTFFLGFCLKQGQELDLEQGAWMLAQTQYPEINVEGYRALLDSYAADIKERIHGLVQPDRILNEVNGYLFEDLGFSGNQDNYYDPDNSYLNRVLDRRTGNPINLSLVYLLVAKRLQLPVTGIGLPGHFICRYQSTSAELYIDPFSKGKLLTKADCVQYLLQGNYSVRDDYLAPVSPRRMLLRVCGNLHQIYLHLPNQEAATRLQRYLVALAR